MKSIRTNTFLAGVFYNEKFDTKTDDYSAVLKTRKSFRAKPFTAAIENKEFTEQWSAADGGWI